MTGTRLRALRLPILLTVIATALIAGGCGSSKKTTTAAAAGSSTSATATATGSNTTGSTESTTATAPADPRAGGSLPADAIAVAAGIPITQAEFDHWLAVAAKSEAAATSAKVPPIDPSDPPGFNNCIAQIRRDDPSLAKASNQKLKADCSELYHTLSAQVMSFLIESDWYQGYATRLKLVPTNAQVMSALNAAKAKQFPTEAKFRAFLKQAGETVADIRFRFEINLIAARLAARQKGSQSAKEAAVASQTKRAFLAGTVCTPAVAMADCSNYHAPG